RLAGDAAQDPGARHQDVDAAELVQDPVLHPLDLVLAPHVDLEADHPRPRALGRERPGRLLRPLRAQIGDRHRGPFADEPGGDGAADPAGATGDDRRLTVETTRAVPVHATGSSPRPTAAPGPGARNA